MSKQLQHDVKNKRRKQAQSAVWVAEEGRRARGQHQKGFGEERTPGPGLKLSE